MTRYFKILTMMLGAGLLLSCTKDLSSPESDFEIEGSQPFHVTLTPDAVSPDTRTVIDGMSIRWEDKDRISLYYSETGKEVAFTNTQPFYVQDTRTGRFDGSLNGELEKGKHYDWYAIYPYENNFQNGKIYGWKVSDASQVQNGNDNRANLAGRDCILFGRVNDVPDTEYPVIRMKPIVAALDCKVTNATGESIKVNQILVRSSRPLYSKGADLDFTQPAPTFSPNPEKTLCTELKVENATDFATGTSAHYYIKVIPQTYAAGDKIAVKVVTDKSSQVFEKVLEEDLVFEAGKIKTFNLNYTDLVQKPISVTKPDFESLEGLSYTYGKANYITWDGWMVENGNLGTNSFGLSGDNKASPGKGIFRSPLLSGGCGTLTFKYYQENFNLDFSIVFKDKDGQVIPGKEYHVTGESILYPGVTYSEKVDIPGDFSVEIRQNASNPTGTNAYDYDRPTLKLTDFSWTPFAG